MLLYAVRSQQVFLWNVRIVRSEHNVTHEHSSDKVDSLKILDQPPKSIPTIRTHVFRQQ